MIETLRARQTELAAEIEKLAVERDRIEADLFVAWARHAEIAWAIEQALAMPGAEQPGIVRLGVPEPAPRAPKRNIRQEVKDAIDEAASHGRTPAELCEALAVPRISVDLALVWYSNPKRGAIVLRDGRWYGEAFVPRKPVPSLPEPAPESAEPDSGPGEIRDLYQAAN